MKKNMKIAILQLYSIRDNDTKLEYYWRICSSKNVRILLLGEYVLNPFFKEIEYSNTGAILEETNRRIARIKELSERYSTILFAPILMFKKGKNAPCKTFMVAQNGELLFYHQQRLIAFEHWNEAQFYENSQPKNPSLPLIVEIDGFKVAVLFGYEAHFDEFWLKLKKNGIDVVCVSSASTFNSKQRWRELLKTRAFLNGCYLARANCIEEYHEAEHEVWKFYGDSFLVKPNGEIEDYLGDDEELLLCDIDKGILEDTRMQWRF